MRFIPADDVSVSIFTAFSFFMFFIIWSALSKTSRQGMLLGAVVAFLVFFYSIVEIGMVARHILPLAPLLFAIIFLGVILFSFSKFGLEVGTAFSLTTLIGIQSFRLPLELILHHWAGLGTIPETMTWTGQNWDVITGVVSLFAIPFIKKSRKVAWGVQLIGFVLLLNVVRVVVMSSPFPFAWQLENPLQLILHFPYALIGPLFVGTALAAHMITFRMLLRKV